MTDYVKDIIEQDATGKTIVHKYKGPLLQTADQDNELDEPRPVPKARAVMTPGADPLDANMRTIIEHGTAEERAGLARLIRERVSRRPRLTYWRCNNPKCGAVFPCGPDYEGGACIACNWARRKSGGHVERMNPRETKTYLRDRTEREARTIARIKEAEKQNTALFNMRAAAGDFNVNLALDPTIKKG